MSDETELQWHAVDEYFGTELVDEPTALRRVREDSLAAAIPDIAVAPNQGALLALFARMIGARRVLEIGTLGGYSAIWLAGAAEHVTTLEVDATHAEVARRNLAQAGVADRVEIILGAAADSLDGLIERGVEPYDLVFIDADKKNNPRYLDASLRLTRSGSVLVVDNVVRGGGVVDAASTDPGVQGTRRLVELIRADPRLDATALQTVGVKGWDGFLLARVR